MQQVYHFPVVTLSNGVRIANHSSAHEFVFEDGSTLSGVTKEQCMALQGSDVVEPRPLLVEDTPPVDLVAVVMRMGPILQDSLDYAESCVADDVFDYYIVPYPFQCSPDWDQKRWPHAVSGYVGPGRPTQKFPPLSISSFRVV